MRKASVWLGCALLTGMSLVNSVPAAEAATGGAVTTITFLDQPPNVSSIDTTGQLVKKFEAANPSIHVNVSYLTLTQEETGVLATRLRSGDGPDVFKMAVRRLAVFWLQRDCSRTSLPSTLSCLRSSNGPNNR